MDKLKVFHIDTKNTSYIFRVTNTLHLEHLYYGKKLKKASDYYALFQKSVLQRGDTVVYDNEISNLSLDDISLEYSGVGKGDFREVACEIWSEESGVVTDFLYKESRTYKGKKSIKELPSSHDEDSECETLEIDLYDEILGVTITLYYHSFYNTDIITRYTEIKNSNNCEIDIKRLMSLQLDFLQENLSLITFNGSWTREMQYDAKKLSPGIYINDSKNGTSSNKHNSFIILKNENCNEDSGNCYGFNLIYSSNHSEIVEVNQYKRTRILTGINPYLFSYHLDKDESFTTPEAIMTFSNNGLNGLSQNMHDFINNHIIPKNFRFKERPVLINNWEATYFNFNEKKLLKLAKDAQELGVELFVLDDGWFGNRNDDTSSLGDWFVNEKKLPNSLQGLCKKINDLGMDFGIWVEPEMISENSELYKLHPEWAIKVPKRKPSLGRNQLILDLSREEVRDYLVDILSQVFSSCNIKYVKWDMNRDFSDMYSTNLEKNRQGELFHRYILGLYNIMDRLTKKFPNILFEGCAAGGNRFDLGILCYMAQIWASDDTDASERIKIQRGVSYGYPVSTMGAHVSDCPNHQTLRNTSIESRFNVAAFGVLGYELNISELSSFDKKAIKRQIEFYKEHREVLQFGKFYRIDSGDSNITINMVVSKDKKKGLMIFYQDKQVPNGYINNVKMVGLDDDMLYKVKPRDEKLNVKTFGNLINEVAPVHIKKDSMVHNVISNVYELDIETESYVCYGDLLNNAGIKLNDQFSGVGYNKKTRVLGDFGSRVYVFEEIIDK